MELVIFSFLIFLLSVGQIFFSGPCSYKSWASVLLLR